MSYWDTSALGKLYFPEADSPVFAQKAANLAAIVTARLALYEMRRVAFRKEAEGLIPVNAADAVLSQLDRDVVAGNIQLLEMDNRIEAEFGAIMAHCYRHAPTLPIRTFDAIHLASARVAGETEMVATDRRLREAAARLGFSSFPV